MVVEQVFTQTCALKPSTRFALTTVAGDKSFGGAAVIKNPAFTDPTKIQSAMLVIAGAAYNTNTNFNRVAAGQWAMKVNAGAKVTFADGIIEAESWTIEGDFGNLDPGDMAPEMSVDVTTELKANTTDLSSDTIEIILSGGQSANNNFEFQVTAYLRILWKGVP